MCAVWRGRCRVELNPRLFTSLLRQIARLIIIRRPLRNNTETQLSTAAASVYWSYLRLSQLLLFPVRRQGPAVMVRQGPAVMVVRGKAW